MAVDDQAESDGTSYMIAAYKAVRSGDADALEELLGAAPLDRLANLTDGRGFTVLHLAASKGSRSIIRLLARTDAFDFGALDSRGMTPADVAREWTRDAVLARYLNWRRLLQERRAVVKFALKETNQASLL